jgi:hypothetical protein
MLASRVASIIRRHLALGTGGSAVPLDEFDRRDLERAHDLLREVVALSFTPERSQDTGVRALVSAGVALSVARQQRGTPAPDVRSGGETASTDAETLLTEVAAHLDAIRHGRLDPAQRRALAYFEQLATEARRSWATSAETVVRRN